MADYYPYAKRFPVNRTIPEKGRPREEILSELRDLSSKEDEFWQTGQCSGTMYCGDLDHYGFMRTVTLPHFPDFAAWKDLSQRSIITCCRAWTTC